MLPLLSEGDEEQRRYQHQDMKTQEKDNENCNTNKQELLSVEGDRLFPRKKLSGPEGTSHDRVVSEFTLYRFLLFSCFHKGQTYV